MLGVGNFVCHTRLFGLLGVKVYPFQDARCKAQSITQCETPQEPANPEPR